MSLEIMRMLQANTVSGNTPRNTVVQTGNKQDQQSIFAKEQAKEKADKRTADVEAHEAEHERVAGLFANGKTIEYGTDEYGNRVAVNGHVNVKTAPFVTAETSLDQIEQAILHATTVAAAAIAPLTLGGDAGKLSSADESVYSKSMAALSAANAAKTQKQSGFEAQDRKPLNILG